MILDIKVMNYQYNFAPRWRFDSVLSFLLVSVSFRIVGGKNCANDVCEDLLVRICMCRRVYKVRTLHDCWQQHRIANLQLTI